MVETIHHFPRSGAYAEGRVWGFNHPIENQKKSFKFSV